MAPLPLGSLSLHAVEAAEEGKSASVASHVARHTASTTEAGCLRRVVFGIAGAATAAPEAAVAVDAVVGIVPAVGTVELNAGCGIVALPDCPGSIRQKPSSLIFCIRSASKVGLRYLQDL